MKIQSLLLFCAAGWLAGQETTETSEPAKTTESGEMKHRIVIEPPAPRPEPKLIYQTKVTAKAEVLRASLPESAVINFGILQGKARSLAVEVVGGARVVEVTGEQVKSWSIRQEGGFRFLEVVPKEETAKDLTVTVVLDRGKIEQPGQFKLTSFGPAEAMGFSAGYSVSSGDGLIHRLVEAKGVLKLEGEEGVEQLTSNGRAEMTVAVQLSAAAPPPAELKDIRLVGELLADSDSAAFRLTGTAHVVSEKPVSLTVLKGRAAPIQPVVKPNYRMTLASGGYQLEFSAPGVYEIDLTFVTPVQEAGDLKRIDFQVASAAVVPVSLKGVAAGSSFDQGLPVIPVLRNGAHEAFLPASGRCLLAWQPEKKTEDGKLFYTSEAMGEISVGAGLVRQLTSLTVRALQGELPSLDLQLAGIGEVLAVEGENVLSWEVTAERILEIKLSRPVTGQAVFVIRSQAALAALPVQIEPLRITPNGVVRHSGYFRIYNRGAVRVEVMDPSGLTQLSPDQYPEAGALPGSVRQVFHYRYPSANRSFQIAAERIKPEVSVSQVLSYELTESERILRADLEVQIREAGIREWEFLGPEDYSVVSLSGAGIADYVVSDPEQGKRRLKVIFGEEMTGRRLVTVHFEKNDGARGGEWILPTLTFPGSTMVRGEIGVSSTPGFRLTPGTIEGLVEMPLARLLKRGPGLQQAFRIRGEDWNGSMQIKALDQNVQADTYHFYSLQEGTAYVSVLLNYFVTGAPVSEWRLGLPNGIDHLAVDGRDIRDYREVDGKLIVPLHRPVMGAYQLLVTYEQAADESLALGGLTAEEVQAERGFIQVVTPGQVELTSTKGGEGLLVLDPLELPTEYQLMSTAPTLKAWQYQRRPFALEAEVSWFERGETAKQVVEFATVDFQLARDGGVVTESAFDVRTRDGQELKLNVPESMQIREVSVNGKVVTLRKAGDLYLVPLPESVSPNEPVRLEVVSISAGGAGKRIKLVSPMVHDTTQLVTKWKVTPDAGYRLQPVGHAGLGLATEFSMENGLDWIAANALPSFAVVIVAWLFGSFLMKRSAVFSMIGAAFLLFAAAGAFYLGKEGMVQSVELPEVLEYEAPVKAPDTGLQVVVSQIEADTRVKSLPGIGLAVLGLAALIFALVQQNWRRYALPAGGLALSLGILFQTGGAGLFFFILSVVIVLSCWKGVSRSLDQWKAFLNRPPRKTSKPEEKPDRDPPKDAKGPATALLLAGLFFAFGGDVTEAKEKAPAWKAGDSLAEKWEIEERRIKASGTLQVTGKAGERFLLARGPATLTNFEGGDLKVVTEGGNYLVVPTKDGTFFATFAYEAPSGDVGKGIPVLTGLAAVRSLDVSYTEGDWLVECAAAVKRDKIEGKGNAVRFWLSPEEGAKVVLRPKVRDVASEEVRFYAEVDDLFIPGPGVVDGRHRVKIRPAQGQVRELALTVPEGFTVSEINSKLVGQWRFDPVRRVLTVELAPFQSKPFYFDVETQRALAELPAELTVAPMRVAGAAGEVGMLALAFGREAQLDQAEPRGMSLVNLADFGAGMVPQDGEGRPTVALQRVYRYGREEASLTLKVAPVAPEIRVDSQQRLSFGEEQIVLAVELNASITRAGIFKLSFPLPTGFEVESLTGDSLNHWVEVTEDEVPVVVMNLNGKTMGNQKFSLVLTGVTPGLPVEGWQVPKIDLREASRQTGQLVIVPGRGIQLSDDDRKDLSKLDPRSLGGSEAGSLAFRLLMKSWQLSLSVDQLSPSVAAMVLQDAELREERSKSRVDVRLQIDDASIRDIEVTLPDLSEVDAQTVRASGPEVRDIVAIEENRWQVRFKRRVVGEVPFRIEFEETVPATEVEMVRVNGVRQQESYLALRPGARLRVETVSATGWDAVDWSDLPKALFQLDRSGAPAVFLRTTQDAEAVDVSLNRHSVVVGAKVRVVKGSLTTVVSGQGDVVNQANLELEAVQRGSLTLTLPEGSRLFGVFVNEESVLVVRDGSSYRFQVVGDAAAEKKNLARLRFTYSSTLPSGSMTSLSLQAFKIGVPLEKVSWTVSLPDGYDLASVTGDLDLVESDEVEKVSYEDYRRLVAQQNAGKEQIALNRLNKASGFFKMGDQILGNRALEQVYNQGNLDDASNEDVRVKMEKVARQNAIIGLNTRRQRLFNDNGGFPDASSQDEVDRIEAAMRSNPVFTGQLKVGQDDFSNIISANDAEVNSMLDTIAAKWVRNQRINRPAGRMIDPVLPIQGSSVTFTRLIQVDGEEALKLGLKLEPEKPSGTQTGRLVAIVLVGLCVLLAVWRMIPDEKKAKPAAPAPAPKKKAAK